VAAVNSVSCVELTATSTSPYTPFQTIAELYLLDFHWGVRVSTGD